MLRTGKLKTLALAAGLMMGGVLSAQPKLTLRLDEANKTVSPTLYGLMTEKINFSYEGGLYAQLIRNTSFKEDRNGQQPNPWTPWKTGGPKFWALADTLSGRIAIEQNNGINRANPKSLRWEAAKGSRLLNDGYWGFPVRPNEKYEGAFYAKTDGNEPASFTVSLVSEDGKTVYASTKVEGIGREWSRHAFSFSAPAKVAATKDVKFCITADESGKYWLTRVTLFPETFNNRPNGLRRDLMTMMCNMHPKFLRFPGGNYVEGNDFRNRFDWKRTVGNPDERPGHMSPWDYPSTDGMGLLEFLEWTEDVGADPLLAVFAGYTLSGDYVTGDYVDGFVRDALDEIEYVIGGPETKWGAQRVKDGHPAPFPLHYVEIGNEDFFDKSGSYPGRFKKFYEAIKAKYPQLQIISTVDAKMMADDAKETGVENVKYDVIDEHYYRNTVDMYRAFHQYDSYDRKGPKIFCGEWASREGEPTTNMNAALGDAAWMAGMERNSDIVIAHCYAPLFVNVNPHGMQWKSDLIGYDALNAYGSPSYYAQCMFAGNVGDKIVPVEVSDMPKMNVKGAKMDQLYYSATRDSKTGKVYLKLVNGGATTVTLTIDNVGAKSGGKAVWTVLKSAKPEDTNSIDHPRNIVPATTKTKAGKMFKLTLAPYSVNVLAY